MRQGPTCRCRSARLQNQGQNKRLPLRVDKQLLAVVEELGGVEPRETRAVQLLHHPVQAVHVFHGVELEGEEGLLQPRQSWKNCSRNPMGFSGPQPKQVLSLAFSSSVRATKKLQWVEDAATFGLTSFRNAANSCRRAPICASFSCRSSRMACTLSDSNPRMFTVL